MVSKAIESSQTKVEGHNFDIRKHLVEYDDVMNTHRDVIYTERTKILQGADLKTNIMSMLREEIEELVELHAPARYQDQWDLDTLLAEVNTIVRLPPGFTVESFSELSHDEIAENLLGYAEEAYDKREQELGEETMRSLERAVMLRTIDTLWVEHLTAMDEMRQGIGLRAYAQTDPLVAYKNEAHDMWGQLLANIRRQITHSVYHVELTQRPAPAPAPVTRELGPDGDQPDAREPVAATVGAAAAAAPAAAGVTRAVRPQPGAGKARKVGRNEPCPCGSGKKYKKCHGLAA
jgi:preprotein translocase subunit SecA